MRYKRAALRSEGLPLPDLVMLVTGKAKSEMGRGAGPISPRTDPPLTWATQGGEGHMCAFNHDRLRVWKQRHWGHAGVAGARQSQEGPWRGSQEKPG